VRRIVTCFGLLVLASLFAATTQAAAPGVQLTEARGAGFPNRAFVLSLPSTRALTTDNVSVTENGGDVIDLSVLPASAVGKKTFGVVLVVDSSESMAGAPIRNAMAAARAFAARRNPNQQLALVTFNTEPSVALPFTTNKDRIDAALSQVPPVAYGTHIYDAVAKAEAMLATAKIQAGSIVVLSDGADTGSARKGTDVARVAREARVRLYAIGLRSPKFDASTLTSLAANGGGDYSLAQSTKSLAPLFDQLSQRIANEYVVRYKSLAGPKVPVHVTVKIAGVGSGTSAYQTPALPIKSIPPYHKSVGQRFWTSPLLMVIFALLVAGTIVLITYGLATTQGTGLPQRMVEFVSVPGLQRRRAAQQATTEALVEEEKGAGLWTRLDRALEIAHINMNGIVYVLWTIVATVLMFLFILVVTGSVWWSLLALAVPFASREFVLRKLAHRRNQFAEQLPDALQVISSALRSGHSFIGALAVVVDSASEPMKSEMQRVVADEQLGIPVDTSLGVVAERMASRDLEQVGLVAQLQQDAGGNAAEVVDRVAETIRERFELRRLIKTLTAQGRMSRWIVTGIPILIVVLLQLINPHYLHPLLQSTTGKVVLGLAAALCAAGSWVIKKIIDIKV
jgi:tight adherence protein B